MSSGPDKNGGKACPECHSVMRPVGAGRCPTCGQDSDAIRAHFAPSHVATTAKATYLIDGKPHRLCDCDTLKGDCPRGVKRQLQTTQLSQCLIPAEGVLIAERRSDACGLLANVIEHWERVPNDIRSDPGMDNLNAAVREADKELGGTTK